MAFASYVYLIPISTDVKVLSTVLHHRSHIISYSLIMYIFILYNEDYVCLHMYIHVRTVQLDLLVSQMFGKSI